MRDVDCLSYRESEVLCCVTAAGPIERDRLVEYLGTGTNTLLNALVKEGFADVDQRLKASAALAVRELVSDRLNSTVDQWTQQVELLRRWSRWLAAEGSLKPAARIVAMIPANDETVEFVLKYGLDMISCGGGGAVLRAVAKIDRDDVHPQCPRLTMIRGFALAATGRIAQATTCLSSISRMPHTTHCGHDVQTQDGRRINLWLARQQADVDQRSTTMVPNSFSALGGLPGDFHATREILQTELLLGRFDRVDTILADLGHKVRVYGGRPDLLTLFRTFEALRQYSRGHVTKSRQSAMAAIELGRDSGESLSDLTRMAETILAWTLLDTLDPSSQDHFDLALKQGYLDRCMSGFVDSYPYVHSILLEEKNDLQLSVRRSWSSTDAPLRLLRLIEADVAWLEGDDSAMRWFELQLDRSGAGADAVILRARRTLNPADLRAASSAAASAWSPFSTFKVLSSTAETYLIRGEEDKVRTTVDQLASMSKEHCSYRHLRMLTRKHPDVIPFIGADQQPALPSVGQPPLPDFTPGEIRVLQEITRGLSAVEVARELDLSYNTVKTHIQSVYRKAGIHKRSQAIELGRSLDINRR